MLSHLLPSTIIFFFFAQLTASDPIQSVSRGSCGPNFTACSPRAATKHTMPLVGEALSGLYFDLVSSVKPQPVMRDIVEGNFVDQDQNAVPSVCCK